MIQPIVSHQLGLLAAGGRLRSEAGARGGTALARRAGSIAVLVLALSWPVSGQGETEPPIDPCVAASANIRSGRLAKARESLYTALSREEGSECATSILQALINRHVALGANLARAGAKDEAKAAYRAALELEPTNVNAHGGLSRLNASGTPPNEVFAPVQELVEGGHFEDAKNELIEILKKAPDLAVPDELSFLTGWRLSRALLRLWYGVKASSPLPQALVGIVLAVFAFYWWRKSRNENSVFIEEPVDDALATGLGKSFAAQLRDHLLRLTSTARLDPELVTELQTGMELPAEFKTVAPTANNWIGTVLAVLSRMTRPRGLVVSSTLHPAGGPGAGLTLELSRGPKILSSHSLWEADFSGGVDSQSKKARDGDKDPNAADKSPQPYHKLAEPAAIWLLFRLRRHLPAAADQETALLGTENWLAFASYRVALRRARRGQSKAARRLFARSLEIDPGFLAPRTNLAIQLNNSGDQEAATRHLRRVIKAWHAAVKRPSSTLPDETRVDSYHAMYQLAVIFYSRQKLSRARLITEYALDQLERRLKPPNKPEDRSGHPGQLDREEMLKSTLRAFRPSLEALLAVIQAHTDPRESRRMAGQVQKRLRLNTLVQYNLASCFSVLAGGSSGRQKDEDLVAALAHLRRSIWLGGPGAEQAAYDSDFRTLRNARPIEFDELLLAGKGKDARAPGSAALGLAAIRSIGETWATRLHEAGVGNASELVDHCRTPLSRSSLLARHRVPEELLLAWGHTAELALVLDEDPDLVNLLAEGGIRSLADLGGRRADQLEALLESVALASGADLPIDSKRLERAINEAKRSTTTIR